MAHSKFCFLVELTTLLTLLRCSTAVPSVTSLKPCNSHNCIVPKTLQDNVTFECTVYSPSTFGPIWEIAHSQNHGLQISSGLNKLKSQGYLLKNSFQNFSTLDISQQARQEHTQIRVQCIEFAEFENMASDYHYVFTYGAPDPPQKFALQASSSSPSLRPVLSWQRPPNIHEDVPLNYHLQITNLTSNISDFNTTDTQSFPLPEDSSCSLFEFSITASNDVGNSTSVSIMETVPITPDVGPINSSLRVLSVDVSGGNASVSLAFDEAETCSDRYRVSDYTVVSSDESISVNIKASSDVNNYTVTLDSANAPNISRGFAYNISVIACIDISDTVCNSNGCQESTQFCRESKTIQVFTTDVQNPRVRYFGFNLNLTCDFAEGSTAEVCFFNFTGMTAKQTFLVNRAVNSSVASSCAMADAVADIADFEWSAFDNIAGVPITVELIPVDEDHFECGPGENGTGQNADNTGRIVGGAVGGLLGGIGCALFAVLILVGILYLCLHIRKKQEMKVNRRCVTDSGEESLTLLDCTIRNYTIKILYKAPSKCDSEGKKTCDPEGEKKCDSRDKKKCDSGDDSRDEKKCDSGEEKKCDSGDEKKCDSGDEKRFDSGDKKKCDSRDKSIVILKCETTV